MVDLDEQYVFSRVLLPTSLTSTYPMADRYSDLFCLCIDIPDCIHWYQAIRPLLLPPIFPFKGFITCGILVGIVSIAWFIAYVFIEFFSCRPFQYWFDKTIKGGRCIDLKMTSYAITTPPDIATNLALLALPLFWLWRLQMEIYKKLAVIGIFILGSLYVIPE